MKAQAAPLRLLIPTDDAEGASYIEGPHLSRLPAMEAASVTCAVVYTAGALRKALAAPSSEPRICFTFAARGARLSSSLSAPG